MLNQKVCWVEFYLVFFQNIYMTLSSYLYTVIQNGGFNYELLDHCDNDFETNGL